MQETPQQYTRRILGYQRGKSAMAILTSSPRKLETLILGVSRKKLRTRPERGRWSVGEILAHLADTELVIGFRMRLVLGSNKVPIQAFDQDMWADLSQYARHDPRLSLEAYRVQRKHNLQLLKLLPRKMWRHYGMHSERGKETITRIVQMMAGHDINHMRQLERIIHAKKN